MPAEVHSRLYKQSGNLPKHSIMVPGLCFRGSELGLDDDNIISFPKALDRLGRLIN